MITATVYLLLAIAKTDLLWANDIYFMSDLSRALLSFIILICIYSDTVVIIKILTETETENEQS
jgi:hypothetical protein